MSRDVLEIAAEFSSALVAADFARYRALTHPDLRVGCNYRGPGTEAPLSRDEAIEDLRRLRAGLMEFDFRDVRRTPTESGYLQLHQAYGVTRTGVRFHVDVALIAEVADGRLVAYREYADGEQMPALFRAPRATAG